MPVCTVGLDLAKNVFQVHGISETGRKLFNKKIRRSNLLEFFEDLPPCVVGMEACGSAHFWGRELRRIGHDARLMPASYVKPYVKRGKTDAGDAEAICEAVRRPTMRFVEVKSEDQQALLALHRTRDLIVRQRTQTINVIRSLLREFGYVLPSGARAASSFAKKCLDGARQPMPDLAQDILVTLCLQLVEIEERIECFTKLIERHALLDQNARRLMRIPGIGPITASAIVATIGDARQFKTARDLAAWLGLTPRSNSSGGKEKLGQITKQGDRYIRRLLIVGTTSRALAAKRHPESVDLWTARLLAEKPFRVATVAMANKSARIIWAVLTRSEEYRHPVL